MLVAYPQRGVLRRNHHPRQVDHALEHEINIEFCTNMECRFVGSHQGCVRFGILCHGATIAGG